MLWPPTYIASARADVTTKSQVLLSATLDAAASYPVLPVAGAGITEWHTAFKLGRGGLGKGLN